MERVKGRKRRTRERGKEGGEEQNEGGGGGEKKEDSRMQREARPGKLCAWVRGRWLRN